jgi:cold shock CspA family protein/ribosome-associated translation inhibitor RaiA
MNTPLLISFHNLPHSPAIETAIREAAARLEDIHDRIVSCRVIVDQPHRRHQEGNSYQVRIDLKVPGGELVVKREQASDMANGELRMVVHEAFEEMLRRLDDFLGRRRGFVKTHATQPHARVAKLFPDGGYGFLETLEGRELFFHQNSVLNGGFRHLEIGDEVRFTEELGDKGPQASTVKPVGKHGHV